MSFVRNAVIGAFAVGAASLAACSAGPQNQGGGPSTSNNPSGPNGASGPSSGTGNLGFDLQLDPGLGVSTVSYTISNPGLGGFSTLTGTLDVSANATVSFSIALPAGSGYTLSLSATDSAGDPCLAGPVNFAVVAGQSSAIGLTLVCMQTIDAGNVGPDVGVGTVTVTADASLQTTTFGGSCAAATVLSAGPSSQAVGLSIDVIGQGIDPNFQSNDVSLTWAATGGNGTLSATSGSSSTFTCTAAGVETITLTAGITGTGASCANTGSLSVQVMCTGGTGGGADSGMADAEADSGVDAGTDSGVDAGTDSGVDAGTDSGVDAGTDSGTDTGTGGGGPPTACTAAPCASSGANSVKCPNSVQPGVCSGTEALIVARDIANGNLDATGQLKPYVSVANDGSCYACLNNNACLDDNAMDTGNECSDAPDLTGGAAGSGVAQCLATLTCITSTDCQGAGGITGTSANASQESIQLCYCGGNNAGSLCSTAGSATNGLCDTQEAAGFGFPITDNKDILANYGSQTYPSGIANQIFNCAVGNKCSSCR